MTIKTKQQLHDHLVKEWKAAISKGDFDTAIKIDIFHYDKLVKLSEDLKSWEKWQKDTLATRHSLTKIFKAIAPNRLLLEKAPKCTAIIHHNYSGLAHETQLARNLDFLRKHGFESNIHIVYLFGNSATRQEASRLYGIKPEAIHYLDASSYEYAASRLDTLSRQLSCTTIVYPSIFWMGFWMSLFIPHSNQKFVAMKYCPFQAGRISHWAGGKRSGNEYFEYHGYLYDQLPILDLNIRQFGKSLAASRPNTEVISFGSISRPEKTSDASYNMFIGNLLAQNLNLRYLYAGREETLDVIPKAIRNHKQAYALGWVEPESVIEQFDIYVEPFPWGGGDMTLLALSAGRPYLILETYENVVVGILPVVKEVARRGDEILNYSFCKNVKELKQRILELASQSELRSALGQSWKHAIENYYPDKPERWAGFLVDTPSQPSEMPLPAAA